MKKLSWVAVPSYRIPRLFLHHIYTERYTGSTILGTKLHSTWILSEIDLV